MLGYTGILMDTDNSGCSCGTVSYPEEWQLFTGYDSEKKLIFKNLASIEDAPESDKKDPDDHRN